MARSGERLRGAGKDLDIRDSRNCPPEGNGQGSADQGADYRNPGVGPVAVAFVGDGEEGVHDARGEIACWVDRIAGGAAEGEADDQNDEGDGESVEWPEAAGG